VASNICQPLIFGMTSKAVADLLLNEGGVAVLPGTDFGANGEGCIRLSYVAGRCRLTPGCSQVVPRMTALGFRA
jgi:aspartate/methionine/tyrosine aminotransferase